MPSFSRTLSFEVEMPLRAWTSLSYQLVSCVFVMSMYQFSLCVCSLAYVYAMISVSFLARLWASRGVRAMACVVILRLVLLLSPYKPVSHPPSQGGSPPLCRWASLDCKKCYDTAGVARADALGHLLSGPNRLVGCWCKDPSSHFHCASRLTLNNENARSSQTELQTWVPCKLFCLGCLMLLSWQAKSHTGHSCLQCCLWRLCVCCSWIMTVLQNYSLSWLVWLWDCGAGDDGMMCCPNLFELPRFVME